MPPCRFFNSPKGCRRGDACNFTHGTPQSARPSPSASTAGADPGPSRRSAGTGPGSSLRSQNAGPPNAPGGACDFYWATGKCKREFDCRFRHTINPELNAPSPSSLADNNRSQSAMDAIAPFLTEASLAKLNTSGIDAFFPGPAKPLSPNEAHNAMKKYLYDDFRFSKTFDVYGFLSPLSNATTSNSNSWTSEDGQLLLNSIATGNGLLRIDEILRWSPVSTRAGSHPLELSFQRGFLPLLRFYSSDLVVKSTMSHLVNGLYMCIMNNCDTFCAKIEACMDAFMAAQSFKDPKAVANKDPIGSQVIASLTGIFFECLTRFKNSTATHPMLLDTVRRLQDWTEKWIAGIVKSPPSFDDPFGGATQAARDHIVAFLRSKVERLVNIVDREQAKLDRAGRMAKSALSPSLAANLDEGIISALRITYNAPGELSNQGRPRHDNDFIDIQDIRVAPTHEELICTIAPFLPANLHAAPHPLPNESMERLLDIQFRLLREELTAPLRTSVQLVREDLMSTRKKTQLAEIMKNRGGRYHGFVNAQESVMFNVYTGVKFSSLLPDRRGLSATRKAFWEGMSGKRMIQGGLVALVWKSRAGLNVHLGVLASSVRDLADSVQTNPDRVSARVVFFDPHVELRILDVLQDPSSQSDGTMIIVEAPVMFEAIRPFLEALRVEPESIPFSQYLLAPLFPAEAGVDDLKLYVNDPDSVRLDPSQVKAVVDALTREVALIQGPPGTGKSFTGVELLRVLVASAKPILMIAFTNHALDHLMTSVLDAGITDKIVRLGSRSADERIKKFSIEELEMVAGRSRLEASFGRNHRELKGITSFLETQYPEHFEHVLAPPTWISSIHTLSLGWQKVGQRGKDLQDSENTIYTFWLTGGDLEFLSTEQGLQPQQALPHNEPMQENKYAILQEVEYAVADEESSDEEDEDLEPWQYFWDASIDRSATLTLVDHPVEENDRPRSPSPTTLQIADLQDPVEFFAAHGCAEIPKLPTGDRPLHVLLAGGDMWTFSLAERERLHTFWKQTVRETTHQNHLDDFNRLREKYMRVHEVYNEGKNEARRQVLAHVDIGLAPRVMLVEEAGQVLEAHILGSLVPSVEHLILIGDPLQLRPTLNNYSRKYNTYEVDMIKDLVLFLLRQGCYSQEGDIVVLCAYLGQLARVRDALADSVAVVIDERDQADLAEQEDEQTAELLDDSRVEHIKVSKRVRLRTVDNYQGEEARIIILSLVRNGGNMEGGRSGDRPTIGFLKEGLFIFGNAPQLSARSHMWRGVIKNLEREECLGDAFPIACHQHPSDVKYISKPGQLQQFAPDGGCLRSCEARLKCGHVCPYKCHPDDPGHVAVTCLQSCRRICNRRHPCKKECAVPCGDCTFEVPEVELPCWPYDYLLDKLEEAFCHVVVDKNLPNCEHIAKLKCSDDPSRYICNRQCGGIMECCSRTCNSNCHNCQDENRSLEQEDGLIARTMHVQHPCRKSLPCAHMCNIPCSLDHKCVTTCKERCRQECCHARCNQNCSTPCSPCQEPCTWACPHHACPLPCGSVCARLPCDKRCEKLLDCGHRCPSVCGEDCSIQVCPRCAPPELKEKMVDLILGLTLGDILDDEETLDEMLITLPRCGHVFTVETLDGICGMGDYYSKNDGKWLDLKSPVSQTATGEVKKPPVCPTCRSAITSPRYGRVFKSADLDILERNVIFRMSNQLEALRGMMERISKSAIETDLLSKAPTIKLEAVSASESVRKGCRKAWKALMGDKRETPTPAEALNPGNEKLFLISRPVAGAWTKAVKPLVQLYERALKVAGIRSAHVKAWEAAWSRLVETEMELAAADPARAPRNPHQYAMQMARKKVGQPQPLADKRFLVEAFWTTIQVRFILSDLAYAWLKAAGKGENYTTEQAQMWATFASALLDGCRRDANIALEVSTASESRRQMTKTSLIIMRVDLERFRFKLRMAEESRSMIRLPEERKRMADEALVETNHIEKEIEEIVRDHLRILHDDGQGWIVKNFTETANVILREWQALEKSVRASTFYEPVSLDEKMNIVKAFDFSHGVIFTTAPMGTHLS
ncbi:hypothetical protein FPV67DRAFT_1488261 [Lyophyllum atratum]|nr:hypothetical protein FPV67DRAFT_1488261 [Lyophyllum atratum]